ncbi:PilN domain-containing protein [Marinobacterium sediminicola]|uniref:General secretion pathway protein L n=1 Tax=Marinobacterium sediminicola TaxID=518898 RepID=A0ABY1S4K3_9GAMM|nr:PilN domain-containing protein [Marinobacterium sediminicola]ULG68424.1 PilN domain-containing protein [Marinobacterium sediminicola]SMR78510.1 general secretion pathway protein L [Marinobacterium sediminicola]
MKTQAGQLFLLVSRVRMFWNWWLTELQAAVPARWRRQLKARVRQLTYTGDAFELEQGGKPLRIDRDQLNGNPALKGWQHQGRERNPLLVVLPLKLLLHKVIQLPAATEPRLSAVLGFELDRHTPFSADQASYSFKVLKRDRTLQRIEVDLFVLPNTRREQLLQTLNNAGLKPDWILPQGQEADPHLRNQLNLLPESQRPHKQIRNRWPWLVLVAAAFVLAILFYYQDRHLQALQAEVGPLQQQAEEAQTVRGEANTLEQGWRFLYERRMAQPSPLVLLDEVTRQLPDHTWINRLELEGGELQLQGESSSASDLISQLEGSALLRNVSFTSPVTINPRSGRERFGIRAQVTQEVQP